MDERGMMICFSLFLRNGRNGRIKGNDNGSVLFFGCQGRTRVALSHVFQCFFTSFLTSMHLTYGIVF